MFKETLKKYRPDVEFVAEAWAPFLTVDFAPHISAVMAQKPDAIFATPWAGEAVQLLRQSLIQGVFDNVQVWWQAMGGSVDVLEGITAGGRRRTASRASSGRPPATSTTGPTPRTTRPSSSAT